MAQSKKGPKWWIQMLAGALVGAVLTASTQFIILEKQHKKELESTKSQFERQLQRDKLQWERSHLEGELKKRTSAYMEIRQKLVRALNQPSPETEAEAKEALQSKLPFLHPRAMIQGTIESMAHDAANNGIDWDLLDQLEQYFQADLARIEHDILSLGDKHEESAGAP